MREDGELGSVYTSVEGEFCVYGSPVNCALFDTCIKFGTLIVVTNTSNFRCSAKPELRRLR